MIGTTLAAIIESCDGRAAYPGPTSGYVSSGEDGEAQPRQINVGLPQVVTKGSEQEKHNGRDVENCCESVSCDFTCHCFTLSINRYRESSATES
jgi:hypothetical protein